jgi:3,4-dihydroxy-9,10-secoandrosta-1,3,5(10)-triene-9,17-dione 4,5-dioxygenase
MPDAGAFRRPVGELKAAGVEFKCGSAALAARRGVEDLARFADPGGHVLELFRGALELRAPFAPTRAISDFVGLGHIVVNQPNLPEAVRFYTDVLG